MRLHRRDLPLLPLYDGDSVQTRHERRREFNLARLPLIREWAKIMGVCVRLTGDNVVQLSTGPAFVTWVLSTGRLTVCTDWLSWPNSVITHKVYDYTEALLILEVWLKESRL